MFIVIIHGKSYRRNLKGWVARECERCKSVQPFMVEDNIMTEHLYFIDVTKGKKVQEVLTCNFCGASFALEDGETSWAVRDWSPGQSLQKLVSRTASQLGIISMPEKPTEEMLIGLLTTARERASVLKGDVLPGVVMGGIAGGAAGVPVALYLRANKIVETRIDELGFGMVGCMIGIAAGALVGAFLWARWRARRVALGFLREACKKHKLDRGDLIGAARRGARMPGWMPSVIRKAVLEGLDA
jgi:hypothetical protein